MVAVPNPKPRSKLLCFSWCSSKLPCNGYWGLSWGNGKNTVYPYPGTPAAKKSPRGHNGNHTNITTSMWRDLCRIGLLIFYQMLNRIFPLVAYYWRPMRPAAICVQNCCQKLESRLLYSSFSPRQLQFHNTQTLSSILGSPKPIPRTCVLWF